MMLGKVEDINLYEVKYKAETILNMVANGSDPKAIQQKEQVNKYAHLKNATFAEIAQAWRAHKTAGRQHSKSKSLRLVNRHSSFGICVWVICVMRLVS